MIISIHTHRDHGRHGAVGHRHCGAASRVRGRCGERRSPDGGLKIIAVAGSDAARDQLLWAHRPLWAYEQEFAVAKQWERCVRAARPALPMPLPAEGCLDQVVGDNHHDVDSDLAPIQWISAREIAG